MPLDPNLPTVFWYQSIMQQLEYNPEAKLWNLPCKFFKGMEADQSLTFQSQFEAHEWVMANWDKQF